MREIIKWTALLLAFVCVVTLADVAADRRALHESLIRLHVVGASDDADDQAIKLQVRDAVTAWLESEMDGIHNAQQAREYLREHLQQIESVANRALKSAGVTESATVSFLEEEFPVREYDTFSLPSGVYHSLRIRIGAAEGRNWWCVIFPTLCLSATADGVRDMAVSSGFEEGLSNALVGEEGYELRFFLLDCLGLVENFFYEG